MIAQRPALLGPSPAPWGDAVDGDTQGLWDWDLISNRIWCSPRYLAALGYTSNVSYPAWEARVHPDDRPALQAEVQRLMQGDSEECISEHRLRLANDEYRWVALRLRVFSHNADGRPQRVLGTETNIHNQKLAELQLLESEARQPAQFASVSIPMLRMDLDGRWLDVNPALCEMFGFSREALLDEPGAVNTHPEDREADQRALRRMLEGRTRSAHRRKRFLDRLSRITDVQFDATAIRDDSGQPRGILAMIQDMRVWRRPEDAQQDEVSLSQITLAAISDGVIRTDAGGRVSFANQAALRLLGAGDGAQLHGQSFHDAVPLFDGSNTARLNDPSLLPDSPSGSPLLLLARLRAANGSMIPIELTRTALPGRGGLSLGHVYVLRDLSHLQRLADQLLHQARHDLLTGLPNRRQFEAAVGQHLERARGGERCSLLHIDLDQFKLINETAGHSAGDRLIAELARMISEAMPEDAVLARMGGDEFALLLPGLEASAAQRIGERLRQLIDNFRFEHQQRTYRVSASLGLRVLDDSVSTAAAAIAQADSACHIAKRLGGGRVQVYHSSDEVVQQAQRDSEWASRIQRALDTGHVELYAQKITPVDGLRPPNYEILIRVRDDAGTLQLPGAFLSAADRYGMSGRVDRWVVEQAIKRVGEHARNGGAPPFGYLSINLTGQSVSDEAFADFLFELLEREKIPPQLLRFEITESAAVLGFGTAQHLVTKLRNSGCRVMLDDFGSGFTSFEYLKQMIVDGLKIDHMFTRQLADDRINQTIVESICRIGGALHLEIIAEGVEEQESLDILKRYGVEFVQGHLFHAAAPLDQLLH